MPSISQVLRRMMRSNAALDLDQLPSVSIIMPIRNEAAYIERSLRAILCQNYPSQHLEVLIVDGMSDDRTREIVQQVVDQERQRSSDSASAHLSSVVLLDNPARIVSPAFNIGLRHARGEIIIRVDGHCEIAQDYVRRCVEALHATGADNVGGLQYAVGHGMVGEAIALATSSPFGVGNARFHYARVPGWTDTVYLGAYWRDVFERIGGFDEELVRNQDDEFNFRLTQAGGKVWLDPAIRSTYYSRTSLHKLWRQYFQYGFYKVRVIQKRGAVSSWRQIVPAAFIVASLSGLLLSAITAQIGWVLIVAGPYLLFSVMSSLWTARQHWPLLPLLPVIFLDLHFAYGCGFLFGIWHWLQSVHRVTSTPSS